MSTIQNALTKEVGHAFVGRHQGDVIGVLHGWDRLRLQGTLRSLYYQPVMEEYLRQAGVLWKDFKIFATTLTARVRQAAVDLANGASASTCTFIGCMNDWVFCTLGFRLGFRF